MDEMEKGFFNLQTLETESLDGLPIAQALVIPEEFHCGLYIDPGPKGFDRVFNNIFEGAT